MHLREIGDAPQAILLIRYKLRIIQFTGKIIQVVQDAPQHIKQQKIERISGESYKIELNSTLWLILILLGLTWSNQSLIGPKLNRSIKIKT